jgi:hypothetical protein
MVAKSHEENRPYAVAIDFAQAYGRRELILELARRLADHTAVKRVWLFGSPVRGDYFAPFGIDLAIEAPTLDRSIGWSSRWTSRRTHLRSCASISSVGRKRLSISASRTTDDGIVIHERSRAEATV